MKDKWTEQFQAKMAGHERKAPELSWPELDKALEENRERAAEESRTAWKRRAWTLWIKPGERSVYGRRLTVAATIALALISGTLLFFDRLSPEQQHLAEEAVRQAANTSRLTAQGVEENSTKEKQQQKRKEQGEEGRHADARQESQPMGEHGYGDDVKASSAYGQQPTERKANDGEGSTSTQPPSSRDDRTTSGNSSRLDMIFNEGGKRGRHNNSLVAGLYMNAMATGSQNTGGIMAQSSPMLAEPYGPVTDDFRFGTLDIVANSNPREIRYDHDYPIKAGLSVGYAFGGKWSVTTGVTYSFLRSTLKYSEGKSYGEGTQKLHYLGIPVSLNYDIVKNRRLTLYLSGGGEMQKLLDGKMTIRKEGTGSETINEGVSENSLQWSLHAALGAQYILGNGIGIYVEPGAEYHFDNGSCVMNYYKKHKTSFSLNLGIRLNIK